jgi:hypothetical protein
MILNRTHHFLFVHVPKTAGMAVSADLSRFESPRDLHFCEPWDELKRMMGTLFGCTAAKRSIDEDGAEHVPLN